MRFVRIRRLLVIATFLAEILGDRSLAEGPAAQPSVAGNWPQKVVVTVGDLRTRIDGSKMWTLSGIDFQDTVMATEDSAYGSVLTIRNVGHLGTAHFLDVPGKPGQVEKEQVESLQFFVDEMPVSDLTPTMKLSGKSFRMERRSKIRAVNLETSILIENEVLIETVHFHATGPIDLRSAYPWMYALTPKATAYVFGDKSGILHRGKFLSEGKTVSQVVQNANWMAVFNPSSGKGTVCSFLRHPPTAEGCFLMIDAPGIYRKVAAYSLIDKIVPEGFDGTYQSAVGFFNASERNWEEIALQRAAEIQASMIER